MSSISLFLNEYYTILKIIKDNTVSLAGDKYCPLSQSEISDISNINRTTCTNIINKLKEENFLDKEKSSNRKYYLTDKSITFIKKIEKM